MDLEILNIQNTSNKDKNIEYIQESLNSQYAKERGTLISCNGLYSEELNNALIYAMQRLKGFPAHICKDFEGELLEGIKNNLPVLVPGEENDFVKLLQYCLYCAGYKDIKFTGVYDKITESAVFDFSFLNKLGKTTIVIPKLWEALLIKNFA